MKKSSSVEDLQARIQRLEEIHELQVQDLKNTSSALMSSLSPIRLLQSTIQDVVATPNLKGNLIDTAVGLGAGFLGRKLFVRKSSGFLKKLAGSAFQFALTNLVSQKLHKVRRPENNGQHH